MKNKELNSRPLISLKITPKHGKVISVASRKTKRIYHKLEADNFPDCDFQVLVRYETGGYNSGVYKSKNDTVFALRAFLEPIINSNNKTK